MPRPRALSASFGWTRVPRRGAIPNNTAVAIATAAVNPRIRQSIDSVRKTLLTEVELTHQQAAAPLRERQAEDRTAAERRRLSARSWRAIRHRDAPSATRMLRLLPSRGARASNKFAMFAQAISSTSATTTMIAANGCR